MSCISSNDYIYQRTLMSCQEDRLSRFRSCKECPQSTVKILHNCIGTYTNLHMYRCQWTRNFQTPKPLYPMTKFSADWKPRRDIFKLVQETDSRTHPYNDIFSLSIEPYSSESQPLYYRFTCLPNSDEISTDKLLDSKQDVTLSCQNYKDIPIAIGFLKPFEHFNSRLLQPDTCSKARNIEILNEEDIESEISDIPPNLKDRIKKIASLFLLDTHAKRLCMTITQPYHKPEEPVLQLLFTKKT